MGDATDYTMADADADALRGMVLLPHEYRTKLLRRYVREHGQAALINLFSQFIGLANSVVANSREFIELAGIIEGTLHPHNADKINLPTIFGGLVGVGLANSIDQTKTCSGCAYRLGTCANQSPITTIDANWCEDESDLDFLCHERLNAKAEPYKLCAGHAQKTKGCRVRGARQREAGAR
jgi:hypothetical protein